MSDSTWDLAHLDITLNSLDAALVNLTSATSLAAVAAQASAAEALAAANLLNTTIAYYDGQAGLATVMYGGTLATTTAINVSTTATVLLPANSARAGFAIQATDSVVYIKLDTTCSTSLYGYYLPKHGTLEIDNFRGPITAVVAAGSTTVFVTEKS
jgi:hypothetical protein